MALVTTCCIRKLVIDFSRLGICPAITQVREKTHQNIPRLRNPYWFIRKTRSGLADQITQENRGFVKEVLLDKFGPPVIIKGYQTYKNAVQGLVKEDKLETQVWTPRVRRTGVLARKIGQYPLWLKNGKKVRTTLLQVIDNHVIKYIPPEEYEPSHQPKCRNLKQYGCLLVGAESTDPSLLTKEYCGLFKDSGVMPKKNLARFLISPSAALVPGTPLNATHFRVGDYVDVRGKTVYHGFQGVVKRHGFKGMPASHGVTKTHRRPGNIGGGGEKARVWPGTKMPGHMGNRWRILKGLRIWRINTKYNVMWVQGSAIAGETNGLVYIYDTILPLRKPTTSPPFPTSFDDELSDPLPENIWYEDVHNFKDPTIHFAPEQ